MNKAVVVDVWCPNDGNNAEFGHQIRVIVHPDGRVAHPKDCTVCHHLFTRQDHYDIVRQAGEEVSSMR